MHFIQKEIIKGEIGPLKQDYEQWRSIKVWYSFYFNKYLLNFQDNYLSCESEGCAEGTILQELLNYDEKYRIEFMNNLKFPNKKSLNETINLIEML